MPNSSSNKRSREEDSSSCSAAKRIRTGIIPLVAVKPDRYPAPCVWAPEWRRPDNGQSITDEDRALVKDEVADGLHAPSNPKKPYTFVEGLWFEDGDIVLGCGQYLLRVHKDKLMAFGGTFEEMFEVPQPADALRVLDLEFCDMSGDDPRDLVFLLGYLYDLISLHSISPMNEWKSRVYLEALLSVLHLADKFGLDEPRKACIEVFQSLYPSEYDEYCDTERHAEIVRSSTIFDSSQAEKILHIQAVNAIRSYTIPKAMPMAYYSAANRLTVAEIVAGIRTQDGNIVKFNEPLDVVRILMGREQLCLMRRHTTLEALKWELSPTDPRPTVDPRDGKMEPWTACTKCKPWFRALATETLRTGFMEFSTNVMDELPEKTKEMILSRMCMDCGKNFTESMEAGIEKAFELMPQVFGWRNWEEVNLAQTREDTHWEVAVPEDDERPLVLQT